MGGTAGGQIESLESYSTYTFSVAAVNADGVGAPASIVFTTPIGARGCAPPLARSCSGTGSLRGQATRTYPACACRHGVGLDCPAQAALCARGGLFRHAEHCALHRRHLARLLWAGACQDNDPVHRSLAAASRRTYACAIQQRTLAGLTRVSASWVDRAPLEHGGGHGHRGACQGQVV